MFSLLGVVEVLLRKTNVAVQTHQPALDVDEIPCMETGSTNCSEPGLYSEMHNRHWSRQFLGIWKLGKGRGLAPGIWQAHGVGLLNFSASYLGLLRVPCHQSSEHIFWRYSRWPYGVLEESVRPFSNSILSKNGKQWGLLMIDIWLSHLVCLPDVQVSHCVLRKTWSWSTAVTLLVPLLSTYCNVWWLKRTQTCDFTILNHRIFTTLFIGMGYKQNNFCSPWILLASSLQSTKKVVEIRDINFFFYKMINLLTFSGMTNDCQ